MYVEVGKDLSPINHLNHAKVGQSSDILFYIFVLQFDLQHLRPEEGIILNCLSSNDQLCTVIVTPRDIKIYTEIEYIAVTDIRIILMNS